MSTLNDRTPTTRTTERRSRKDRTDFFARSCGALCLLTAVLTAGLPAFQDAGARTAADGAASTGATVVAECARALDADARKTLRL